MTTSARVLSIVSAGLGLALLVGTGIAGMKREQAGRAYAGPASDCGFCRCEPCRQPDAGNASKEGAETHVSLNSLTMASVATGLMRSVW